nr:prenyltransferase [Aspergillus striatus]
MQGEHSFSLAASSTSTGMFIASLILMFGLGAVAVDRLPLRGWFSQRSRMIGPKQPAKTTGLECPYEYIRKAYGHHHWAPFIDKLSPTLREGNPAKYYHINEVMDGIHLCLILVDDISDASVCRKGHPAAHILYGPSETLNRAYYVVTQLLTKTTLDFPHLAPWLLQDLEDILHGQDLSLNWRRDGLSSLPADPAERAESYKQMASLKTGSLFRLLGHLALEDRTMDGLLTQVAWYSQLQNDCKDVFSSEYGKLKGSAAEDLSNKEFTYPIMLALGAPGGHNVAQALESPTPRNLRRALRVIQSNEVYGRCMHELKQASVGIEDWLRLWGRKEKLDGGR